MDFHPDGFEWINCSASDKSIVVFLRKTKKKEETLLFICNFDIAEHPAFPVGVPFYGKYKEIFNSNAVTFGGSGSGNPRAKISKVQVWDERENSITVKVPPLSVLIFTCTPEKKPAQRQKKRVPASGMSKEKQACMT